MRALRASLCAAGTLAMTRAGRRDRIEPVPKALQRVGVVEKLGCGAAAPAHFQATTGDATSRSARTSVRGAPSCSR